MSTVDQDSSSSNGDGHKNFINIIEDPQVRERIRAFVARPHPDNLPEPKKKRGNPNLRRGAQ